jgi:hypothetical protein
VNSSASAGRHETPPEGRVLLSEKLPIDYTNSSAAVRKCGITSASPLCGQLEFGPGRGLERPAQPRRQDVGAPRALVVGRHWRIMRRRRGGLDALTGRRPDGCRSARTAPSRVKR